MREDAEEDWSIVKEINTITMEPTIKLKSIAREKESIRSS
jgi:hypothetical protein